MPQATLWAKINIFMLLMLSATLRDITNRSNNLVESLQRKLCEVELQTHKKGNPNSNKLRISIRIAALLRKRFPKEHFHLTSAHTFEQRTQELQIFVWAVRKPQSVHMLNQIKYGVFTEKQVIKDNAAPVLVFRRTLSTSMPANDRQLTHCIRTAFWAEVKRGEAQRFLKK